MKKKHVECIKKLTLWCVQQFFKIIFPYHLSINRIIKLNSLGQIGPKKHGSVTLINIFWRQRIMIMKKRGQEEIKIIKKMKKRITTVTRGGNVSASR